jgi:hypothetical protein
LQVNGEVEGFEMADTSREGPIHQVTFEIEQQSSVDGKPEFQARARLNGIVIQNIGSAEATELEAFDLITRGCTRALNRGR